MGGMEPPLLPDALTLYRERYLAARNLARHPGIADVRPTEQQDMSPYPAGRETGQRGMALPASHAAVAKRARACCRGTLKRGYGLGRRLHARGS